MPKRHTKSRCPIEAELTFSEERCLEWFNSYTADDPETIEPDGVTRMCSDIDLNPDSILMLILAWKLKAQHMGFFTQKEWLTGFSDLQCDCADKLKRKLPSMITYLDDPNLFREIYRFSFGFTKDIDKTTLAITDAKLILGVLLETRWPLLEKFQKFLDITTYKVMSQDQWNNVLEFSRAFHDDLSKHDPHDSWTLLMDDFVEWVNETYVSGK